jgi:hypothetical protein
MMDDLFNKQRAPEFPSNLYLADKTLIHYLHKFLPKEVLKKYESSLVKFGGDCKKILPAISKEAELFKPIFEKYDAFGK